jgi:hypothetical protein
MYWPGNTSGIENLPAASLMTLIGVPARLTVAAFNGRPVTESSTVPERTCLGRVQIVSRPCVVDIIATTISPPVTLIESTRVSWPVGTKLALRASPYTGTMTIVGIRMLHREIAHMPFRIRANSMSPPALFRSSRDTFTY